jgi:hypothetical protein
MSIETAMRMKRTIYFGMLVTLGGLVHAGLSPGDVLTAYEVKNVRTGKEYCQICAYAAKTAKLVAFGELDDEEFWADLKRMQALHESYKKLGVFAQVIDSNNIKAIQAAASQHDITFPVVVAAAKDWDKTYKVQGVSRTVYYVERNNRVVWSAVGLEARDYSQLKARLAQAFPE